MQIIHRKRFDNNIMEQFEKAMQIMQGMPIRTPFFVKSLFNQKRAAKRREKLIKEGLEVPPLLIISITKRCNLNCAGCYSKILHTNNDPELTTEKFREILAEATELGVSIVLLAGGEPLVRKDFLEIAAEFPQIMFPIFTNGLLLNDDYIKFFSKNPNLLPVISLEGGEAETDFRRGEGVYNNFDCNCEEMNRKQILWGTSLTVTSKNMDLLFCDAFITELLGRGCKLFFFVEYVPIAEGSENLVLSEAQKAMVQPNVDRLMASYPAMFIAFPGDEEQYDGCLAAGRGFMHINPSGKVEPCPFAPFSDTDLHYNTLREALSSEFLAKVRDNHHLLKEGKGGCALWANREWLRNL
ncbi:MAG: radical SAM protein [Candidatus Cloacimonetes bacterium]|nr:radical SAM protein [Candidatus Cloacimonadota bacterium]